MKCINCNDNWNWKKTERSHSVFQSIRSELQFFFSTPCSIDTWSYYDSYWYSLFESISNPNLSSIFLFNFFDWLLPLFLVSFFLNSYSKDHLIACWQSFSTGTVVHDGWPLSCSALTAAAFGSSEFPIVPISQSLHSSFFLNALVYLRGIFVSGA